MEDKLPWDGFARRSRTFAGGKAVSFWRFARSQPLGAASVLFLFCLVLAAVFADLVTPYGPYEKGLGPTRAAPSWPFIMGNDNLGRDSFTRLVFGSRVTLLIGISATGLAVTTGTAIGLLSGFLRGWPDMVMQRVVDALVTVPGLVLAMAMVAVLGQSTLNVIIALAVGAAPPASRVIRGAVLSVSQNAYVDGARAIGCGHMRIMLRHILPNVFAPILIIASVLIGGTILAEASLSFLGLGPPPPTPSWGRMINESRLYLSEAPWLIAFPGAAITLVVLAFNFLGDAVRDMLDPKLRGR